MLRSITHDKGVICALAHRPLVMTDGVVFEQGPVDETFMTSASVFTGGWRLAASAWQGAV